MKIFVTRRRRKKYRSVMIIEWFDITGFTNIHVYTYTPNYIYNSGVGGINWNWRENDYMSNNEHFGWSYFVWMFGDIYVCYHKISKIWHSQFSIQNVTSFFLLLEIFRVGRWIFKEYSRCDFFYTERTNGKNVWNLILGNVLDIL